jgi:spore maturation protein CgeB
MMIDRYNSNINWIIENSSRCKIENSVFNFGITFRIVESSEDEAPSLLATLNDTDFTIHSQLYPVAEAKRIAQNIEFTQEAILIIGLGLGYVATEIRNKYPEKHIILYEPDIQLFYLAMSIIDLSILDFEMIIAGHSDISLPSCYGSVDIYVQKSLERLYAPIYNRVINRTKGTPSHSLSDQWKYKKFTTEQCRILFIDSAYVLTKECLSAIKNTGNIYHYIHIDIDKVDYEVFVKQLMNDILNFKPDFVLTINHLGFDQAGRLTELFTAIELPFVSWFVDSPNVILSSFNCNISDYCHLFVWDDDYIPEIKALGYKYCDFLPLATDTEIFYPKSLRQIYPVSFVGSSMSFAIHKNMKSWCHRDDLIKMFPDIVAGFVSQKTRHVEPAMRLLSENDISFDNNSQRDDFLAAVLWRGTQIYRRSGIDQLHQFQPTISGDPNWSYMLPVGYQIISERWYYDNLVDFYNQSTINFNMTSLQMTNAINQRVFDVSACRQFVLTDHRRQIDDLFDGSKNIVYFNDINEIPELLNFYVKNQTAREKYSQAAFDMVHKHHTYQHRVKKLIQILKSRY